MNPMKNKKNRTENSNFCKSIVLLFLVGFFLGAAFYYLFQNSFSGLITSFEKQLSSWPGDESSLFCKMVQAVWNHGRFFALFWLLSVTVIHKFYQSVFLLYTGFRNGFLIVFFIFMKGPFGILLYLASLFPHALLLIPLYLFSFAWVKEKGYHRQHKWLVTVLLVITFFAACFLEAKCNYPLMEKLL